MQGLADGYFVLPYTIGDYLACDKVREGRCRPPRGARGRGAASTAITKRLLDDQGQAHGRFLPSRARQDHVGLLRHGAQRRRAQDRRSARFRALREQFWRDVKVLGDGEELNQSLEKAGRVADFFELAELMCLRRAGAQRVLRRSLPRGVPDAGRRGAARRRALLATSRPGSFRGDGTAARAAQGAADVRIRAPRAAELQVMRIILHVWRQSNAERRGQDGALRSPERQRRTCRSSKCSTC